MHDKNKLVGMEYPIKDEKGNVVASRSITAVYEMNDMAAYAISLSEDKDNLILLGYKQAIEMVGE